MPEQRTHNRPVTRKRQDLSAAAHVTLAALFAVSQVGFIYSLHNRSHTLLYSIIVVTIGCLVNVYTSRARDSAPLSSLVLPAVLQSIPLNIILYAVAHFKEHINDFLDARQTLHSRASVISSAFLYGVLTLAVILSAYVRTGLPTWTVKSLEAAAFLSLIGHIAVTTTDAEGLLDVLTMTAAALATFSTRLYWGQSFEVFHPPGAHGHYEGPVATNTD